MILLAIDPGPEESAWVEYDAAERRPLRWAKEENVLVSHHAHVSTVDACAIEMIASYGMAVGQETFDTCVWVGRFVERWMDGPGIAYAPRLVYRREVKLHLCGDSRAKDPNIRQALIDRFGGKEQAIGRKATPGPLYGMTGDCWSALGVAITAAETGV